MSSSYDLTQLNVAINSDVEKLDTWLQGNKIPLNVAKPHLMLISTKQTNGSLKSRNEALELKTRNNELKDKVTWSANRLVFTLERAV